MGGCCLKMCAQLFAEIEHREQIDDDETYVSEWRDVHQPFMSAVAERIDDLPTAGVRELTRSEAKDLYRRWFGNDPNHAVEVPLRAATR